MGTVRNRPGPPPEPLAPDAPTTQPCCPAPGEIRVVGRAVWWYAASGEWRIVPEEVCSSDGGSVTWRRPAEPLPCSPRVWRGAGDIVFAPVRSRGVVVAVRVVRVTPGAGGIVVRGVSAEGDEVELRRDAREFFVDAVEAALEIACPPRLDTVVEFATL